MSEIDKIKELLKKQGWEYYAGQSLQGEEPHFFIKGKDLIQVVLEEDADEETLEAIRGD